MKTSFATVALDRLRYSQVWEDPRVIEKSLQIGPADRVLVISSGGGNVFNALLSDPEKVYAVDLNPLQNEFLALQIFIIRNFPRETYLAAMGYRGPEAYKAAQAKIKNRASPENWERWSTFFSSSEEGLALAGKLESYISSFRKQLPPSSQDLLRELFAAKTIEQQKESLAALLECGFEQDFKDYFDRANLSKGRDIGLYKHSPSTGGALFFQRFSAFAEKNLLAPMFIANFFFFGPRGAFGPVIPHFCRGGHYKLLQSRLQRIELVNGEAVDFLTSREGQGLTKAVLSNIFEYVAKEEFDQALEEIRLRGPKNLRLVFWNLLNDQGAEEAQQCWQVPELNDQARELESCFYFGNVRLFHFSN